MLVVSLNCPCSVFFDVYSYTLENTEHGQSRETGNIRHTGRRIHVREYRTWTIQRNYQHKAYRTKNFLWIVHVRYSLTCILRPVCLMLVVSLDCPCSVFSNVYSSSCMPYVGSFSGLSIENGQSRATGNIRHTGRRIHVKEYRTWTIQRNYQHKAYRTKNTR
jgi:hypothetical protein